MNDRTIEWTCIEIKYKKLKIDVKAESYNIQEGVCRKSETDNRGVVMRIVDAKKLRRIPDL